MSMTQHSPEGHHQMDSAHDYSSNLAGIDTELDLAEMEIASGRFGEARLRFARMTRLQRELPRTLLLRARATETEESRRMLAAFIRTAVTRHSDSLSRSHLATALALCGDRTGAMQTIPPEKGLSSIEMAARQTALDALGSVPDLPETEVLTFTGMLARKLLPGRSR